MAQQIRAKAQLERLQKELEEKAKRAGIDALVDISGSSAPRVVEVNGLSLPPFPPSSFFFLM